MTLYSVVRYGLGTAFTAGLVGFTLLGTDFGDYCSATWKRASVWAHSVVTEHTTLDFDSTQAKLGVAEKEIKANAANYVGRTKATAAKEKQLAEMDVRLDNLSLALAKIERFLETGAGKLKTGDKVFTRSEVEAEKTVLVAKQTALTSERTLCAAEVKKQTEFNAKLRKQIETDIASLRDATSMQAEWQRLSQTKTDGEVTGSATLADVVDKQKTAIGKFKDKSEADNLLKSIRGEVESPLEDMSDATPIMDSILEETKTSRPTLRQCWK